jgi:hypothetical protein
MATDLQIKAMMNRLADYERRLAKVERYAASGRFLPYTPVLGGVGWAIGDGSRIGAYVRIGNLVHFWARVIFGATSTYGAANRPTITLPTDAEVASTGVGTLLDASCTAAGVTYALLARPINTPVNAVEFYATRTVVPAVVPATVYHTIASVSSTVPNTWTSNDRIFVQGVYEAKD